MLSRDFPPENAMRLAKRAVFYKLEGCRFESDFLDTEDLIQDTLVVFWEKYVNGSDEIRNPVDLMFAIADRIVKSALRKKRRGVEHKRSVEKLLQQRVPFLATAFPMEALDQLRGQLNPADAKVINFVLDYPNSSAEQVASQLGITLDAYRASFFRIRSASWSMRQEHALTYVRECTDFTPDALRGVFSFTQSKEERLEFAIALGLRSYRPFVLNRVEYGDMHFDTEEECAAVRALNQLIDSVKRQDPSLQLAIHDWHLFQHLASWGAPDGESAALWIRLASKLHPNDTTIQQRFEDHLWIWFNTHAGYDATLYKRIIGAFDELNLRDDHPFRNAMAEERSRKPRPEWMLPYNYRSPFP